ncbi:MAG: transposase [Chloroflexota bacterium]
MGYQPQTTTDIQANLAEQLAWQFAERDDQAVAQALVSGAGVDAVHTLDEAGLLDGFFVFLQETKVLAHWHSFEIEAVQRVFLPAISFVLLYGVRLLFGIESTNALPALLFSNVAVMSLIGFTAYQVTHGLTHRGEQVRRRANDYALMDPQTLAETISKASASELERLFNGTIHGLAAFGLFMAEAMVAVDGTPVITTARYSGCGCQRKKQKRSRAGVEVQVVELLFGWRLIVLVDLVTLIPLALKIVQIQSHEAPYLLELVQQAQRNLEPYSRIRWLVVDRAYVDGPSLYALHELGIKFVVIAKTNMKIYATACRLSQTALIHKRVETRRHGHGSQAWDEPLVSQVRSVTDLRDWATYRPPKQPGKRLARPQRPALNAVVVQQWRNEIPAGGARVYLTNLPVTDPWPVVDAYDDRSWIENGLFRQNKQFWRLTRWFPQKKEAGVRSHLIFVMLMFAVATAYRLWDKQQSMETPPQPAPPLRPPASYRHIDPATGEVIDPPSPPTSTTQLASHLPLATDTQPAAPATPTLAYSLLDGQGTARWRRELAQQNRDKVIVFKGNRYGIFDTHELMVLSGIPVRDLPLHLGSRTDILRRYGCLPNSP